jgi:hypothetical protein
MRLINNQRLPLDSRQLRNVGLYSLVGGDDNVELLRLQDVLQKIFPRFYR